MIIGWYTPIYADTQRDVPILETIEFELLGTDHGRLYLTIKAHEMRQYESGNIILAGSIEIVLLGDKMDKEDNPTYIQAHMLSYNKEQDLCIVTGNVMLNKPQQQLSISTEQLCYDIKNEILFTELPLIITNKKNVLKGSGLHATKDLTKYTITTPNGTIEIKQKELLEAHSL